MENPLSKFVPFLVGEFPRSFQDLYKKVSQNEQINNKNLEKELKSFSIKLEELNKAFEELKEKLSNP